MEHFVVSARKYRPETFASVVGQPAITRTLKNAIAKNQLGHAYLFCGPRGVGKTTCARIFAKTINCSNLGPDIEPCNQCESCTSFNESRAFNIHELDAASNNSVEDVRNLTEQVRIPPQVGKYSVYIIDEVHMLSQSAFNAFLKTLEEPPAHAVFILATTEKHKIIPTILSRCQIFDFNRIRVVDIVGYLKQIAGREDISFEEDALNIIALKADGAMRDALSIFDQIVSFSGKDIRYQEVIENLNVLDYDYYFRMVDACRAGDYSSTLLIFNEIMEKGFDVRNFLGGLATHLRDLLVCKDPVTLELLEVGAGIRERYKQQSQEQDQEWLYEGLDILGTADNGFRSARNGRLHAELALLRICQLAKKKVPLSSSGPEAISDPDVAARTARTQKDAAGRTSPRKPEATSEPVRTGDTTPARREDDTAAETESTAEGEPAAETESTAEGEPAAENKSSPGADRPLESENPVSQESTVRRSPRPPSAVPSIKNALNGVKEKDKDVPAEQPAKPLMSQSFDQETLTREWMAFTEQIKETRPRMANSLKHHAPVLGDAWQIELELSNSAMLEEFNREIKPDLVEYLEQALQNNQFKLLPQISAATEKANTLYTDEEKFEHMKQKNPELGKLKERFNLDFE